MLRRDVKDTCGLTLREEVRQSKAGSLFGIKSEYVGNNSTIVLGYFLFVVANVGT